MAYFTAEQWVALFVMGAVGIVAILRVLAYRFEHDRALHDLRVKARTLRRDYNARMAALKQGTGEPLIEAEVVGEIGPAAAEPGTLRAAA